MVRDLLKNARDLLGKLGPGVVAGASDNDPTSVATLSVIGSTTIYGLTWLVLLVLPMLLTIQVISSRVGLLTGRILQQAIRKRFGHWWAIISMILVVSARPSYLSCF